MNGEDDPSLEEAIIALSNQTRQIAQAITADGAPGRDETGGTISSLTEAAMGITAGLCDIASAIRYLAEAIRESNE